MQFIEGQGLDDLLHQLRRLRSTTKPLFIGPAPRQNEELSSTLASGLTQGFGDVPSQPWAEQESEQQTEPIHPVAHDGEHPEDLANGSSAPADRRGESGLSTTRDSDLAGPNQRRYYLSVARIGVDAAEALAYAHAHTVLHRDVKPANLLLDRSGTIWLTDFGLAKVEGDELTRTGEVVGTLRYLAPERFAGRTDARSDVYGLGLTLYELATLTVAFAESDRHRLVHQIMHDEPPAPRLIDRNLPRDLETIIVKAIAKEPAQRYQSADLLAEDLRRFLGDRPILARRITWLESTWRWCRRNPLPAALSAIVLFLIMTTTIVSLASARQLNREAARARRAERDALDRLYHARLAQARSSRVGGQMGQRFDSLAAVSEAVEAAQRIGLDAQREVALRSEAMAGLAMPDLRVVKRWQGWPAGTNGVAFDSRYQHYAQHQRDGTISFRQVDGDKEMARRAGVPASQLDRWVRMKYSPNDRYMVVAHVDRKTDRSLQIWDMATEPVISLTLPDVPALCDFDRDDKSVWVGLADKTIRRYELPSGRELDRFPPGCTPHQLALRPDGRMLAVSTGDFAGVEVRDTKSGAIVHKLSLKSGAESLAWPPDGQVLATGCEDHHIYLWRSDNWQSLGHLEGHRWYAGDLSFSRSGAFLVSLGLERTLRLWDVAAGKSILSLPNPKAIGFSRDDSVLGVQIKGTELGICEMHDSRECRSLTTRAGENVLWVGFSHDSKLMATAGQDGIVVWDAEAATPVARLPIGWCAGVLFEPNDRAFLAFAAGELMRWPIEHTGDRSSAPNRIGKGERIAKLDHPPDAPRLNWVGPSGSKMTVMNRKWTGLLDLRMPAQLTQKWDTPDAGYVASSPDGRWIATGTYSGKGIRIWDAKNNVIAQDWLIGDAEVAFSPDGRRLVIATGLMSPGGSECISWDVGAWKSGARYTIDRTSSPAPLAFSSDGKILAVAHTMTDIVLLDAETFRELATLQAREPLLLSWITFSPDGRWLAGSTGTGVVQLWDLRLMAHSLNVLGLDDRFLPQPTQPR